MGDKFYGKAYRFFQGVMRRCYPSYQTEVTDNEGNSVVYVSHHQHFHGPLATMLWMQKPLHIWALAAFCNQKACCEQIVQYPFVKRFGWNKNVALIICFPLSFIISALVKSSRAIPVYRGSREIMKTFHQSVEVLRKGESIIIFPDLDYANCSPIIGEIDPGFLHIEKYYYQATKKHITFIPTYASKTQQKIVKGKPILFKDGVDFKKELARVQEELHDSLMELAYECGDEDRLTTDSRRDVVK